MTRASSHDPHRRLSAALLSAAAAALLGATAACAGARADDAPAPRPPTTSAATAAPPPAAASPTPTAASAEDPGTVSEDVPASARALLAHINRERRRYETHEPYAGLPFAGRYVERMTWALVLAWDDDLARAAQEEAQALAAGGAPRGKRFGFQNDPAGEPHWIDGLDTPRYRVSARSVAALAGRPGASHLVPRWHIPRNGMFRMSLAYQTGGAVARSRAGVGRAETAGGDVWWVVLVE